MASDMMPLGDRKRAWAALAANCAFRDG